MNIQKSIRMTVVILAGIALVRYLLIVLPGPIAGIWSGPPLACMCDCHNFLLIRGDQAVVFFEYETTDPPRSYSCMKGKGNSWQWLWTAPLPNMDELSVSIKTKTFILTPHLLHMEFQNLENPSENSWFLRDWRRRDALRIVSEQAQPQNIDYFVASLERTLREEHEKQT